MKKTKLSIVRDHMAAGQWQEAIRLAAKFPRLGEHRGAILDAHMAYTNPRFAAQLKKDVEAMKAAGIEALLDKYGEPAKA